MKFDFESSHCPHHFDDERVGNFKYFFKYLIFYFLFLLFLIASPLLTLLLSLDGSAAEKLVKAGNTLG